MRCRPDRQQAGRRRAPWPGASACRCVAPLSTAASTSGTPSSRTGSIARRSAARFGLRTGRRELVRRRRRLHPQNREREGDSSERSTKRAKAIRFRSEARPVGRARTPPLKPTDFRTKPSVFRGSPSRPRIYPRRPGDLTREADDHLRQRHAIDVLALASSGRSAFQRPYATVPSGLMRAFLLQVAKSDELAESGLKVIAYFDALVEHRATLEACVRAAAASEPVRRGAARLQLAGERPLQPARARRRGPVGARPRAAPSGSENGTSVRCGSSARKAPRSSTS